MANQSVAVCILAKHDNPSTKRAIDSAKKFGLNVYLGLTHDPWDASEHANVHVFQIKWLDNFSHARNQLLDQVTHKWVLWIDSDEALFSFPTLNWDSFEENIFYVRTQFNSQFTPRVHVRMHKNDGSIRWQDRIHEKLVVTDGSAYRSRFISSLIIRHDGYEDQKIVLQKHSRNLHIAQPGLAEAPTYAERLTQARTETAFHQPNFMNWFDCYQIALETSDLRTQPSYFGFEAAFLMCIAGYAPPAKKLLEANPLNIYLQLAVLANQLKYEQTIDTDRLDFLTVCLQNGLYDVYENFPCELLGADKDNIVDYLRSWINEWQDTNMNPSFFTETTPYIRVPAVDVQSFDGDLLLMHQNTRKVVVLNDVSSVLWGLLDEPSSLQDLTSVLHQAFPNDSMENIKQGVSTLLTELLNAELIEQSLLE